MGSLGSNTGMGSFGGSNTGMGEVGGDGPYGGLGRASESPFAGAPPMAPSTPPKEERRKSGGGFGGAIGK